MSINVICCNKIARRLELRQPFISHYLILSQIMTHWLEVNEQRDNLHEIRKRKANWIGHILRRNCLLQQVIEGKIKGQIEVTRRRGRRRTKLLDDLKDRRGYSHLKEEALDRTIWRAGFGRGYGPVVRQTTKWMSSERDKYIKIQLFTLLYHSEN